jgi:hypothetical protein
MQIKIKIIRLLLLLTLSIGCVDKELQKTYSSLAKGLHLEDLQKALDSVYILKVFIEYKIKKRVGAAVNSALSLAVTDDLLLAADHAVRPRPPAQTGAEITKQKVVIQVKDSWVPLDIIFADYDRDIVLLRVPAGSDLKLKPFPFRFGNSKDLRIGSLIYMLGNPRGYGLNVREGIVSGLTGLKGIMGSEVPSADVFMISNGVVQGDSGAPVLAIRDGKLELVGLVQGTFTNVPRLGWAIRIEVLHAALQEKKEEKLLEVSTR